MEDKCQISSHIEYRQTLNKNKQNDISVFF